MANIPKPAEDCNRNPTASSKNAAFTASTSRGASNEGGEELEKVHSFSRSLARQIRKKKGDRAGHAAHEATVLKYLANRVNNSQNIVDGKQWFYTTLKFLHKKYPYIGRSALGDIVHRLEKYGYCEIANFNRYKYDYTFWYHVPEDVRALVEEDVIYFSAKMAKLVGVPGAILHRNFDYWMRKREGADLPRVVHMSPAFLAENLPFSVDTIKRGLKALEGKYVKKVSLTVPLYERGDEYIGADLDGIGADLDGVSANLDGLGANLDDDTYYKTIGNPLETCSKGQASPSLCEHSSGDTNDAYESVHLAQASTDADGQGGIGMCHDEDTVSPTVPLNDDIQDCVSDVNIKWPHVSNYEQLQSINRSNNFIANAINKDPGAKQVFFETVDDICRNVMAYIGFETIDRLHYDCDEDQMVAIILPFLQDFCEQARIDRNGWLFELFYYGSLECFVGAFLWPENYNDWYYHGVGILNSVTYDMHLLVWKYFEDIRVEEVEAEFAQRRIEFASADEHKENDITLAPAEKTRVFRNGLNARNQVGWIFYDQQHRMDEITGINKRSLGLVQKLFVHNPQLSPANLLSIMDQVMKSYISQPKPMDPLPYEGWYPPKGIQWHARRAHNLLFFITNLHTVVAQLNMNTTIKTFLRDVKAEKVEQEEDIEAMAA